MVDLQRNLGYPAAQKTAHGFVSLLPYEYAGLVAVGVAGWILGNALVAIVAVVVVAAAVVRGRDGSHGRREYLMLWTRPLQKIRHYRVLDPDTRYEPRGLEK